MGAHVPTVVVVLEVVVVVVVAIVVVVVATVVVVDGRVVLVVVAPPAQSPETQASQQLDCALTQAVPPGGGLHAPDRLTMLQVLAPVASVRQQVTAPALPHAEFDAQFMTTSAHSSESMPDRTAWFFTP